MNKEKMYHVSGVVEEYSGYKNVPVTIFCRDRERKLDFGELILDHDGDPYVESAVEECFTESELSLVREFLAQVYSGSTEIRIKDIEATELVLPYPEKNVIGVSAMAVGGDNDFIELSSIPGYSLPFSIEAYYDFRACDDYDESRHHPSIWWVQDDAVLARILDCTSVGDIRARLNGDPVEPVESPAEIVMIRNDDRILATLLDCKTVAEIRKFLSAKLGIESYDQ